MTKITVTRALSEIKTLESRIYKSISDFDPFEVAVGEKLKGPHSSMKPEDFAKEVKEEKQSIKDLITRQTMLKDAISKSNYETKVKLGEEELTVMQVLNRKQATLKSYERLKNHLESCLVKAKRAFDSAEQERSMSIDKMVTTEINAATSGKVSSSDKTDLIEKYSKMIPEVKLLDPAEAEKWLKEVQEYTTQFEHEVDYILSESNSTTFIEIPD